jgi:hypothetical protein
MQYRCAKFIATRYLQFTGERNVKSKSMQKIITIFNERSRKIAFLILISLYLLDLGADIAYGKLGMTFLPISIWSAFDLLFAVICIVLIYYIRGPQNNYKNDTEIGIWGYVWISFIIYYGSLIILLITLKLLFGEKFSKAELSHIVYVSCISLTVSPLIFWLFFSKDRKGQLMWCISLVRGY